MNQQKPKLSIEEQIVHLQNKGVKFDLCSTRDAALYLADKNNFLRLASYRFMFTKQAEGADAGKYLHLDFAYLVDLASMDRLLREVFLLLTLDIEHYAKVKLLSIFNSKSDEDGYAIVKDFKKSLPQKYRNRLDREFDARGRNSAEPDVYTGDLIEKYRGEMPIWVFLEIVSFGTFLTFYKFCASRWDDEELEQEHYILKSVKSLRNACAHNSCIINGFRSGIEKLPYETPRAITDALNTAGVKNGKSRRAKLRNPRMGQIAATLYAYNKLVTSDNARKRDNANLRRLRDRCDLHRDYYEKDNALVSFFDFMSRMFDIWC